MRFSEDHVRILRHDVCNYMSSYVGLFRARQYIKGEEREEGTPRLALNVYILIKRVMYVF